MNEIRTARSIVEAYFCWGLVEGWLRHIDEVDNLFNYDIRKIANDNWYWLDPIRNFLLVVCAIQEYINVKEEYYNLMHIWTTKNSYEYFSWLLFELSSYNEHFSFVKTSDSVVNDWVFNMIFTLHKKYTHLNLALLGSACGRPDMLFNFAYNYGKFLGIIKSYEEMGSWDSGSYTFVCREHKSKMALDKEACETSPLGWLVHQSSSSRYDFVTIFKDRFEAEDPDLIKFRYLIDAVYGEDTKVYNFTVHSGAANFLHVADLDQVSKMVYMLTMIKQFPEKYSKNKFGKFVKVLAITAIRRRKWKLRDNNLFFNPRNDSEREAIHDIRRLENQLHQNFSGFPREYSQTREVLKLT